MAWYQCYIIRAQRKGGKSEVTGKRKERYYTSEVLTPGEFYYLRPGKLYQVVSVEEWDK